MEFGFNWPTIVWENYVLICWWDSNISNLGWKVKGQPWPLKLIYRQWTEHIKWEWFWLPQYSKINFTKNFLFKCIRKQTWPWRLVGQGHPRIIIWTNLVGPTSSILHTKSQGHWPSGSVEKKIFKRFLPYMGVAAIFVMWPKNFV